MIDNKEQNMAAYYEHQMSGMTAKKIKEMPSKEVFKVSNPNDVRLNEASKSPIKAMMICKPPEDSNHKNSSHSYSKGVTVASANGTGSSTNRGSIKPSNRNSLLDNERPYNNLTPNNRRSQSRKKATRNHPIMQSVNMGPGS